MDLKTQERLPALDSLRAIAALAVLSFHYTGAYEGVVGPHIRPVQYVVWGHYGVELFFVISGFVIAWTLERSSSLADFAFGRIARLYPAYLAAATITTVLLFGIGFNPLHIQASEIPWNAVIGLPPLIPVHYLDPAYWTLGLEVSFYALAAAVTFGLPKLRFEIFCLVWLAASFVARTAFPEYIRLQFLIASSCSDLFVAGAMLFALTGPRRHDWLTLATFAAAILACFVGVYPHWLRGAGISLLVALVFVARQGWLPFLNWRPLAFLGQASYSLYLIHQMLGYWIITNLEQLGIHPFIAIAVAALSAVAAAICLRIVVEKPAQRFIRNTARTYLGRAARMDLVGTEKATAGS